MLHGITAEEHGPFGQPMSQAVQACVHCGFCLAACPTYRVLGQEMDSPRGRIILMKEVLEGQMKLDDALPHVDRCLGCLACEPACPSGVEYRQLLSPFRALAEAKRRRPLLDRLRRGLLLASLPYPSRFRWALRLGSLASLAKSFLPKPLRGMLDLLPTKIPPARPLPSTMPAEGEKRGRVALFTSCAQQVLAPEINHSSARVLARNGLEVLIPPAQGCCGALAWHVGALGAAQKQARRNLAAFPEGLDAIVTNAAGCGSGLHEYPLMLRGHGENDQAQVFAGKVQDISQVLHRLGIRPPKGFPSPVRVAYQDACHLSHGQGVREEPRALLRAIPRLELIELPDSHLCCGSAGSYNLDQPEIASELGSAKAKLIIESGCELVVTGNIGCLTQLQFHLRRQNAAIPVMHVMPLLDLAYEGRHPLH